MSWNSNQYTFYIPSVYLSAAATFTFLILSLAHLTLSLLRKRLFGSLFVLSGLISTAGFAARVYSHYAVSQAAPWTVQLLIILLSPIFYFAAIVMFFSPVIDSRRVARRVGSPSGWISVTFILAFGNLLSLIVQAAGSYRMIAPVLGEDDTMGSYILIVGIALQCVLVLVFVFTAVKFGGGHESYDEKVPRLSPALLGTIHVALILMLFGDLARCVDLGTGDNGWIRRRDWTVYVFDAAPMVGIMLIGFSWYGAEITTRPEDRIALGPVSGPLSDQDIRAKQVRLRAIAEMRAAKANAASAAQRVPPV